VGTGFWTRNQSRPGVQWRVQYSRVKVNPNGPTLPPEFWLAIGPLATPAASTV